MKPFAVKVLNLKGVIISRHESIYSARKKYSLGKLTTEYLRNLRYKKIIKIGNIFIVPYALNKDEIMERLNKFNDAKNKVDYRRDIKILNGNYTSTKNKTSSFIAVLNNDFTINYIWQDSAINLAKELDIKYSTLKASLCKFAKNKKAYLSGKKKRENENFFVYLKDI